MERESLVLAVLVWWLLCQAPLIELWALSLSSRELSEHPRDLSQLSLVRATLLTLLSLEIFGLRIQSAWRRKSGERKRGPPLCLLCRSAPCRGAWLVAVAGIIRERERGSKFKQRQITSWILSLFISFFHFTSSALLSLSLSHEHTAALNYLAVFLWHDKNCSMSWIVEMYTERDTHTRS